MTLQKISRFLSVFAIICLTFISVALLVLIVTSLNKGFELSDESYYAIATKYSGQTHTFGNLFGLVNHFFTGGSSDLIVLRWLKLIYQLLALVFFMFATYKYLVSKYDVSTSKAFTSVLILLPVGLINYDYLPMTLSYNTWSLVFSLISLSLILLGEVYRTITFRIFSSLLTGICLFGLLLVKLPNAVVIFLFYIGIVVLSGKKDVLKQLAGLFLGLATMYTLLMPNLPTSIQLLRLMLSDINGVNHVGVGQYFEQIILFFQNYLEWKILVGELLVLIVVAMKRNVLTRSLAVILIIVNAWYMFSFKEGNSEHVENDAAILILFMISSVLLYSAFFHKGSRGISWSKASVLIIVLILLPFLLAAGTNNSIFYTASHFSVFFVAAVLLLMARLKHEAGNMFVAFGGICLGVLTSSVIVNGMIDRPYRQQDLKQKIYPLDFSPSLSGIKESKERFVFLYTLHCKMKLYNPDRKRVTSSFAYCGASYLSDFLVIKDFWLPDPGYGIEKVNQNLSNMNFGRQDVFVVMASQDAKSDPYLEALKRSGLDLRMPLALRDSVKVPQTNDYVYLYSLRKQ